MMFPSPRREHLLSAYDTSREICTHRFAVVAFFAMLIGHPIMFTKPLSSQPPDDPADALVALFADGNAPDTLRIVISK